MLNPIEKSVGATARDYSTIIGWESDTDSNCTTGFGSGDYASPCSPVGVLYDDADFNEAVTIGGATTSEDYHRKLTVAEGERHDRAFPKSSVGAKITGGEFNIGSFDDWFELEWVILYAASTGSTDLLYFKYLHNSTTAYVRQVIIDNADYYAIQSSDGGLSYEVMYENCIFISRRGGGASVTNVDSSPSTHNFDNCTLYQAGDAHGARGGNYTNCISIVQSSSRDAFFGGTTGDYNICGNTNGSGDTTAPGANSIDNVLGSDLFADLTPGAEDLHLKSDSTVAAGAGTNLSAYFTIDIDGETRSNWDIGADEYVSGGGSVFSASLSLSQSLGVSSSGQASAVSTVSMGKSLAVIDGGQGNTQSSVSLDEVLQIINSGSAVSSGQIQVGNVSQIGQSGTATAQGQTALSDIKSIQVSGLSATSADVSLAQILSFVSTYGSANNVSLALSKSLGITASAAAQIVAIAQLNHTDALAVTGSAQAASALSLAYAAGIIVSSNAPQVAVLALAMQAGVGVSATIDYSANAILSSQVAISSDANAQSKGSLTLSQRVALVSFGQALAASGLTISNIKSIQFIGSTVTVSLVLPNGRTFVVEFEARTFTVKPS